MTTQLHAPQTSATRNLRVTRFEPLPTPRQLRQEQPLSDSSAETVAGARRDIRAVLGGTDDRLLVIVGPCSIHDPAAGLDYARRLARTAAALNDDLLIVMRAYFEKPRTTVGWKGLINDPHLDGSHDISLGLRTARRFLGEVTDLGLPVGTEFLEPVSPQYLADLVAWGAIGARTTESQIHRQLVSGLSMPVGFKNGTDGGLQVALDACVASSAPQSFLGIDDSGRAALVTTTGNPDAHLVLRGGSGGPNYSSEHIAAAGAALSGQRTAARLIVDASHANSGKDHVRQAEVAREIAALRASRPGYADAVAGVMLESFLVEGAQKLTEGAAGELRYGQSITDACMDFATTESILEELAASVRGTREASR